MISFDVGNFTICVDMRNMDKYGKLLSSIDSNFNQSLVNLSHEYQYYFNSLSVNKSEMIKINLKASNEFEHDKMSDETIDNVDKYLASHDVPQIVELYNVMFPGKKCFRDNFVGVYKRQNLHNFRTEFYNIGINPKEIESLNLQEMVNYYYHYLQSEEQIIDSDILGFILYILYERIHPHEDGNGRIGRLLFIENVYHHAYFPFSVLLKKMRMENDLQHIYNHFNFPYILYSNVKGRRGDGDEDIGSLIEYPDKSLYLSIRVDDSILKYIVKLLCLCKEYKILHEIFSKSKRCHEICAKLIRMERVSEDRICEIIKDDELYDKFNKSRFNLENHVEIIHTVMGN